MGKNKQVLCKICYKTMRSDHLRGHMKIHEENGGSKRKYDEMEEDGEALKKYLIEKTNEYKAKITINKMEKLPTNNLFLAKKFNNNLISISSLDENKF